MDAIERMVFLATCAGRADAELKAGALRSHGVRAVVATDDAGGQHPQLGTTYGAVRLLVPHHEVDRARDLLDELESGHHALPSQGEHERIAAPRPRWPGWVVLALLVTFLAYRAVTLVVPGMG